MKTHLDEEIEKYPATPDWPMIIGTAFIIGFGIAMLVSIF
jgi:hypothetical protein